MTGARKYLEKEIPGIKIIGTEYGKAFASRGSVFGYRPRMLPIRQFCYFYGKELFSTTDWKTRGIQIHPLGYNSSQALLVFAHSVPNNTLPIIWSSKNNWIPLYPRSAETKLSRIAAFQKDTRLWALVARKIGLLNSESPDSNFPQNIDFPILAMIRLKRQKRIPAIICQIMGITINNYNEIIQNGIKKDIFDSTELLTPYGIWLYESLKKSIRFNRLDKSKKKIVTIMPEYYIPKKFLGKT